MEEVVIEYSQKEAKEHAKGLDEFFDFRKIAKGLKGFILESLDGQLFLLVLTLLREKVFPKLDNLHKELFLNFLEAIKDGNITKEELLQFTDVFNQWVDVPGLDEVEEQSIFKHSFGMVFDILENRLIK